MAAVVLRESLLLTKQQAGVAAAAVSCIHRKPYSSDVHVIKRPSLAHMPRGTGGRSSFNGVVATVFGATSSLGRNVVCRLGNAGTQVIVPYRGDTNKLRSLKLAGDLGQILFLRYDLRDEESIRQAVKYSNVVVNCIGKPFETRNFTFDDVHVHGARAIAKIAREAGVQKLVHVSAMNCSPKPKPIILKNGSGFLRSKFYGELAVREEFPDAVIIRPSQMFGEDDHFMLQFGYPSRTNGKEIPVWKLGLECSKMPIARNDVSLAIWEAIKSPYSAGQTYNAQGPRRYSLHDLYSWYLREMCMDVRGYEITDASSDLSWLYKLIRYEYSPRPRLIHKISIEPVEAECTTDKADPQYPRVAELGIQLTLLEDNIRHLTEPHRMDMPVGENAPLVEPPQILDTQ